VEQEQAIYGDIIQGSFPESYRSLSFKHRTALNFLSTYCANLDYKYVLKTDDDMVLDLQSIIAYMKHLESTSQPKFSRTFFCAHLMEEDLVPRNQSYKWYISPEEYPGGVYPPYCYGNGYLMTHDLIQALFNMSLYTRNFWVDDAYFSGFIARNLGDVTHAELPFQHPLYSKVYPPEIVLEKKKWLVHTWQDVDVFDAYWYGFESRHDVNIRKIFSAGVKHRTGMDLSDSVFEGVTPFIQV
jgi:Galactosyltransferase